MRRRVWTYYLQKMLVDGVNFTTPFLVIYLLRYVSIGQVILLNSLQFIVIAILEIPSGVFADVSGKREALMIGCLFSAASVIFFLFGDSVLWFAMAFICSGVGSVMISGSQEPLIYDFLEDEDSSSKATEVFAKGEIYSARVSDFSYLIASGLAAVNLRFVFLLEFLKWLVSFFLSDKLYVKQKRIVRKIRPYYENLRSTFEFLLVHKYFSFIIIMSSVVYSIFSITSSYYQPLMSAAGINLAFFGFAYVLFNQSKGIASRLSFMFEKKMTPKRMVFLSLIVKGLVLMGLGVFVHPAIVIVLLLTKVGVEWFRKPYYLSYLTKFSPRMSRASVHSFASFVHSILFVFLSVAFKFLTDGFTMYFALFISGVFLLFMIPLFRTERFLFESQKDTSKKSLAK